MISRLRVKNYKSLKDLDLRLKPLTVFVGPNNAGKSNILDALLILSEWVNEGAGAIHSRGGFGDIVWNGELKRTISITLEGELPWEGKRHRFLYDVELVGGPQHCAVNKEQFTFNVNNEPRRLLEYDGAGRSAQLYDLQGNKFGGIGGGTEAETKLRGVINWEQAGPLMLFSKSVSVWTDYVLDTVQMRVPPQARRDVRLHSTGQNLSSVLHTLQTEDSERFERIIDLLKVVVPEVKDVYTPLTEQGQTLVRIREQGLSIAVPLWALADGTLHTLGILAALYAPNPPSLMCFEEPENFVHPRVLDVLAEAFREASEHSQILMTTHSPYFLDCFKPEDLVIVEKIQGSTKARRATRRRGIKEALEVLGLGEAWYSGSIGGVP